MNFPTDTRRSVNVYIFIFVHLANDVDGAGVQHVEQPGGEPVPPVLCQPALTWEAVLDTFGWHGYSQLVHQPAALWSGPVVAQLEWDGGSRRGGETTEGKRRWTRTKSRELHVLFDVVFKHLEALLEPSLLN